MADSTTSQETTHPGSQPPGPDNPINQPDPSLPAASSSTTAPGVGAADHTPNLNPNPYTATQPPHFLSPTTIQPYPPLQAGAVPPPAPSFRPHQPYPPLQAGAVPPSIQAVNFRNTGVQVQPPGVSTVSPVVMPPAVVSGGGGSVTVSSMPPMMSYAQPPNPAMRPYAPMPNGYPTIPGPAPPGILRYPPLYASMVRPGFPQRPLGPVGFVPALSRPPVPGIRGPILPPVVRPAVLPIVTPTEKPQPTAYVNKISSTVENEFMLSLLQLCGPVKSWKRPQDPTTGALKGFGICEFDSAEGVLRALRLLSTLNVDGQELMLKVSQATREYLERYVAEKKKANTQKENQTDGSEKEEANASSADDKKDEADDSKGKDSDDKDAGKNKEIKDIGSFGLVTDEDKEADQDISVKLKNMLEERLKSKPLPPPPPPPVPQATSNASGGNTNSELPAKSRDGGDHDGTEDKNDDETTSGSKHPSDPDKDETVTSPDRNRRNDRRSRDRERDLKREKERELERLERDREQERAKRERDREYKSREDERRFRARLKEWESREREREHTRKLEREREKEREQERKWEISDQEREIEEVYSSKKRKYRSSTEDRKRRLREKEEDLADRLKEEVEIAEAKKRAEEERELQHKQAETTFKILSASAVTNGSNSKCELPDETNVEIRDTEAGDHTSDPDSEHENHIGDHDIHQNGTGEESNIGATGTLDTRQSSNVPIRKLGFGLVGSGKRTAVPSVFHEEEDEDAQKDKKMRPLVPIDYSAEELQAVNDSTGAAPSPNLAAAAEFAKRIASVNPKEDRPDAEKGRGSRRTHERSSSHHRDREDNADKREHGFEKAKTQDNRKLLDAKQLIDTIPKTKDELFSYEINWVIYDKNDLHEKMRPWISKKITEFLGEEEPTLVDYIVQSTREHMKAPGMLESLQSILDDEAEMFVLKLWRMLIFEIKRVETGLVPKSS